MNTDLFLQTNMVNWVLLPTGAPSPAAGEQSVPWSQLRDRAACLRDVAPLPGSQVSPQESMRRLGDAVPRCAALHCAECPQVQYSIVSGVWEKLELGAQGIYHGAMIATS